MYILVLDTETTGLKPSNHEIIEIAMVSYFINDDGEWFLHKKFEEKLKPQRIEDAEPIALEVNGYSAEKWQNAKTFKEVLPEIKEIIEKSDLLLGQNLYFDLSFIQGELKRLGQDQKIQYPPYIDTKSMADPLVSQGWLDSSRLDYLCERLKVDFSGRAHTALVDCERTFEVFQKLLEETNNSYELYTFEKPYRRKKRHL